MKQAKVEELDEIVDSIEIKGVKYDIFQGKRGGKYYIKNGKKVYYKETTPKVKKEIPETKRYYVNIRKMDNFVYTDDWTEWVEANSPEEARLLVKKNYPNNGMIRYNFTIVGK